MIKYSDIREVHLEISTRCNAACPGCIRNLCGVEVPEVTDYYPICDMRLDEVKRIFPQEFLKQVRLFLINGNYGDFVTSRDGVEVVKYLASSNPYMELLVSTNGSARPLWWAELGKIKNLEVQFCLDGLEDTHELYRKNTNWNMVIDNAKKFIEAGGNATWKMIMFDYNEHQVDACRALSQELGFREFRTIDHGRNTFPVFNRNREYTHSIGKAPAADFEHVLTVYKEGVDGRYLPDIDVTGVDCYSSRMKSIYVCANGEVYPCCYLGIYPHMTNLSHGRQVEKYVKSNNALEVGLSEAINWFSELQPTFTTNQLYICKLNCGCN